MSERAGAAPVPASFRDPAGGLFRRDGELLRGIRVRFSPEWEKLTRSGFLDRLAADGLLVPHAPRPLGAGDSGLCALIAPREIDCVSYPGEWSFEQLRAAALLTIDLQLRAMDEGFGLKDAQASNVQFDHGRPLFIDTTSFTPETPGAPWVAYRQFCEQFLAPLLLEHWAGLRCHKTFAAFPDGIPLRTAASLLPAGSLASPLALLHVHLHVRMATPGASRSTDRPLSKQRLQGMLAHLRKGIERLRSRPDGTWESYYQSNPYAPSDRESKERFVGNALDLPERPTVWDLGSNTGHFSRIAAERARFTLALDADPGCVSRLWLDKRTAGAGTILPLVFDWLNPTPAAGWAHAERTPLHERCAPDVILALALVHHVAIGGNVPLERIAAQLAALAPHAVVEFIPPQDPRVSDLMRGRESAFPDYSQSSFEAACRDHFDMLGFEPLSVGGRVLYHLRRRP